jgi:hypothetical protein
MSRPPAKVRIALRCGAAVVVLVAGSAQAAGAATTATTTFAPTANARVQQANPKSNYGGLNLRSQGGSAAINSYIKFSISGLSGTVTNATFSLVPLNGSSSGFALHGAASSSWTESGLTWNNAPQMMAAVSAVGAYGCCARVSADATPLVTGNGALTVVLTSTGTPYNQYKNLEWGATDAPELAVTTSSAPPAPAQGTFYVSTAGNDGNPGTQAAPWRTIGHAASAAGPGATVMIMAGSYPENVTLSQSGQSGAPITFENVPGSAVSLTSLTVNASNVAFSGVRIAGASGNCVTINPGLTNITLSGDTIASCGSDGISFKRPGNPPSTNYTSNVAINPGDGGASVSPPRSGDLDCNTSEGNSL